MNAAYATLVNETARQSYDQAHGVRTLSVAAPPSRAPRFGWFSAKKPAVGYADYYHLLRIDREADDRIIQLAYDFWAHGMQSQRVQRERIDEAHRTLSNPQLRAQYDARRQDEPPPEKVKITKQEHAQIQNARHNEIESTISARITAAAAPQERPPSLPSGEGRGEVPAIAEERPPSLPSGEGRGEVPAIAEERPPSLPNGEGRGEVPAIAEERPPSLPIGEGRGEVPTIAKERPPSLPIGEGRGEVPSPTIPPHLRAPTKLPVGRQLADAQHNRLLQLREDVPAQLDSAPAPLPQPVEQQFAPATIAFVSGSRSGEHVELVGDVMTLGSGAGCDIVLPDDYAEIEPEHARLMRRGATYMFHDLAGHDTAITNCPLPLTVVTLEDGDEIQIGEHRMRFTTADASERQAVPHVAAELQLRPRA